MSKFGKGWYGVDLDGTLAEYFGWKTDGGIGNPIPAMVKRVKGWLAEGIDVRIMTARVNPKGREDFPEQYKLQQSLIQEWCLKHVGRILPICYEKDLNMIKLYDDRAVQVIENTGELLEDRVRSLEDEVEDLRSELYAVHSSKERGWLEY